MGEFEKTVSLYLSMYLSMYDTEEGRKGRELKKCFIVFCGRGQREAPQIDGLLLFHMEIRHVGGRYWIGRTKWS